MLGIDHKSVLALATVPAEAASVQIDKLWFLTGGEG
jgi:hypothetical protein